MTIAGLRDRGTAIDALLAVARRETLLLAVAVGAIDDDGAAVACARLRWAIGAARQLIAALEHDLRGERLARELDRIANRAQRWLVEPPPSLAEVRSLVERIAARRGRRTQAIAAEHASLVDLDLDDLELSRIELCGASLTEVSAQRTGWEAADARSTRWLRCRLEAASLAGAVLSGSTLEHCDLSCANLEATSWQRATLAHCALPRAVLIDARLDRAVFSDCDLRGADLEIARAPAVAALAGARFVRCDLRDTNWRGRELTGATFVDCKLAGAHGATLRTGAVIEGGAPGPRADHRR